MTNKKPSRNIIDEFRNVSFEVVEDVPFTDEVLYSEIQAETVNLPIQGTLVLVVLSIAPR